MLPASPSHFRDEPNHHSASAPVSPNLNSVILSDERDNLLRKVIQLSEELENEHEIRIELETAKRALVSEVEELSQALFEEAGSMVAKEARARAAIETSRKRLESELGETRERLGHQTAQLEELRNRLQSMSISAINISDRLSDGDELDGIVKRRRSPITDDNPFNSIKLQNVRSYCEVLFPDQKFSSRRRSQHHPQLWASILDDLVLTKPYREFADFVEKLTKDSSSSSSISSHLYYKSVIDREAENALYFPGKSATFPNRVIVSMMANECVIEKIHEPASDDSFFSPNSPSDGLLAKLTNSVTSLPDTLATLTTSTLNNSSKSLTTSPVKSPSGSKKNRKPVKCSLCFADIPVSYTKWRMRLSPKEQQWRLMDEHCRDRLVAVGDFCAFLRHVRAGLYSARPLVDLYAEQLHHRRNIFYMRTQGIPFFIVSDFEQFKRRQRDQHQRRRSLSNSPDHSDDAESTSSILYKDDLII